MNDGLDMDNKQVSEHIEKFFGGEKTAVEVTVKMIMTGIKAILSASM